MARDARGRFLPGPDKDKYPLNKRARQKGYATLQARIKAGLIPSRVAAHLRRKIRGHYQQRKDGEV